MRMVQVAEDTLVEKVWPDEYSGIPPGNSLKISFKGKGKKPLVMLFDCRRSMIHLLEILKNLLWSI